MVPMIVRVNSPESSKAHLEIAINCDTQGADLRLICVDVEGKFCRYPTSHIEMVCFLDTRNGRDAGKTVKQILIDM